MPLKCEKAPAADMNSTDLGVDVVQDLLNGAMLFDQVYGFLWTDPPDSPTVVTAQQDAQVYELSTMKTQWSHLQWD